jgi:hypothetical protein
MRTVKAQNFYSDRFEVPQKTVAARITNLQAEGLVAKGSPGRHGGVDLEESDAINIAFSLILDLPYGADIGAEVRRLRDLPVTAAFTTKSVDADPRDVEANARAAHEFCSGLAICRTYKFGDALDSLIRDFRKGSYAQWARHEGFLGTEIRDNGASASIFIDRGTVANSATFNFGSLNAHPSRFWMRTMRLHHEFFRDVAQELGPLTE